jgi:hypothetical protein
MTATRTAAKTAAGDLTLEVSILTRALKAPTLRESVPGWLNGPGRSPGS